jgi:uncharacterized protein (UPF0332 family)
MNFDQIKWCLKQKKGIKLVEPNDAISEIYIKESLNDFEMIDKVNQKWRTVTAYYSCYNSVYAILMKIGIKCEIHDCTIGLMEVIGFGAEEIKFLNKLKTERVDVQYYLKPASLSIDKNEILLFLHKCKILLKELNDDKINEIRKKITKIHMSE